MITNFKIIRILALTIFLFLITGCESIAFKNGYVKKERVEAQIQELEIRKTEELNEKIQEIITAKDKNTELIQSNFQKTSDFIFGAKYGLNLFPTRDRLWTIVDNRLEVAQSYAPPPTKEALIEQVKSLKEELDTTRVSNEELAERYNKKVEEANLAVKIQKDQEGVIARKEKEYSDKIAEFAKEKQDLQNNLNKINDDLLAAQNTIIQNDKANKELKMKLIWIFSIAGILVALGGGYFKNLMVILIGCGFIAIGVSIPFISVFIVNILVVSLFVVGGGIIYFKVNNQKEEEKAIADRAVGAIQDIRNDNEELYQKEIRPATEEWFRDSPELKQKVEKKLVDLNVKAVEKIPE